MADLDVMLYHGIRENIRRVLVALGPERIERGLTAFEDGSSSWSHCFFARALDGDCKLESVFVDDKFYNLKRMMKYRGPVQNLVICEALGDYDYRLRVAIQTIWHTFDGASTRITKKELQSFINAVLDESRPKEVMDLLRSIDYSEDLCVTT